MSLVHYVDTDEWRVSCADPAERVIPLERLWTFVPDRVTCPECLRVLAEKGIAPEPERRRVAAAADAPHVA